MSMIEKLLSCQTIQGPYLGENRPLVVAPVAQNFQVLVPKAAPAPVLQSLTQQLQLTISVKSTVQTAPGNVAQMSTLSLSPTQLMTSAKLSPVTISQIQDHSVSCRLDLGIEELLLLEAMRRHVRKRPAEQLIPSPFAQLTWVPFESPFSRRIGSRRKLSVRGLNFINFRFSWEEDEARDERRRRQREGRDSESEA